MFRAGEKKVAGLRHHPVKLIWWGCCFQINLSVLQCGNLWGTSGLKKVRPLVPWGSALVPQPGRPAVFSSTHGLGRSLTPQG